MKLAKKDVEQFLDLFYDKIVYIKASHPNAPETNIFWLASCTALEHLALRKRQARRAKIYKFQQELCASTVFEKNTANSPKNEKRDCTVRALSLAASIPYEQAHDTMAMLGRKPGKGFVFEEFVNYMRTSNASINGLSLRRVYSSGVWYPTFGELVNACKRGEISGRWIIRVSGHVFAVVDNKIMDSFADVPRRRIKAIYKFQPIGTGQNESLVL
ncbi:MAG TPA: hypothetical protein VFR24_00110 [Candidatus Angelobacter sp.]|nr:hypothetical protein [Candidatus Angelobacter sp.]